MASKHKRAEAELPVQGIGLVDKNGDTAYRDYPMGNPHGPIAAAPLYDARRPVFARAQSRAWRPPTSAERAVITRLAAFEKAGGFPDGTPLHDDTRRSFHEVANWMIGNGDGEPSKVDFDRTYTYVAEYGTDSEAATVERAAIRNARESGAEVFFGQGRPWGDHAWGAHRHRKGHHRGPCDILCRQGVRAHPEPQRMRTRR